MAAGTTGSAAQPLRGRHVLLGVSGGIAAYKAAETTRGLRRAGASVQAVLTPSAARFVTPATFEGLTGRPSPTETFEHAEQVPHVRLAREADVALFAPATAHLIARLANGLADDLLTNIALCLTCPVLVAPAMHTEMWEHPATAENVARLRARGVRIVGPDSGQLAGGDVGPGRLVDPDELVAAVVAALGDVAAASQGPLAGCRVLITAGGTREPIDPVRFIGNRSSGRMGYAIAHAALLRGADVDLVTAPTGLDPPPGARVHRVQTALQMRDAVLGLAADADVIVKAAAVADFRPTEAAERKIKKDGAPSRITLTRNPDILAELGASGLRAVLVGFAAETDDLERNGHEKLQRKGLDLIVVNPVDGEDAGFEVDTNRAVLLGADGMRRDVALTAKSALAEIVLDAAGELLEQRTDRARPR